MGIIKKYWGVVTRRGLDSLWREIKGDFVRVLVLLLVIVSLSYASGVGLVDGNYYLPVIGGMQKDLQIGAITLLVFAFVLVAINAIVTPPKMHEELGGFVDKPIICIPEPHPEDMGITDYWRGLRVKNRSPLDVTECMLRLMSATNLEDGKSILRREEDLEWSQREGHFEKCDPKTVTGNLSRICDVARWQKKTKQAYFETCFSSQGKIPIGEHKLEIRISGKLDGHNFKYVQELILIFDGSQIFFEGEQKKANDK